LNKDDRALKDASEDEVRPVASPATEQAPEEAEESKVRTEEKPAETGKKVQKKGYSQRVRQLANKAKAAEDKAKSLEETIAELTGSEEPRADLPTFEPQVKPGAEISPEQYKQDVMRSADALVTLRVKQSEAANRINNEASEVIRTFPELDPESGDFNEELSDTVTEATEAYVKANPYTGSVKKFVAKLMKPYKRAVTKEVGKATEQITKQAAEAALKPTSVRKDEKTVKDKTIAELEQELGVVQT
jgi:hypothetical protein